jgi:NAD+ kinase
VRVLVLVKRTGYTKYVEQEHDARVASLLEAHDPTVQRMLPGHRDHEETVAEVRDVLSELRADAVFDDNLHGAHEARVDLVVTVGGDGTLLAASHQIGAETPILGVNSAPEHSVGFFCAAKKGGVRDALAAAFSGRLRRVSLARMRVDLNGARLHARVLNEALFCHLSPAATSRYILRVTGTDGPAEDEEQKSSGLWVGPAAGSTAAQKSAGGRVLPLASTQIQYVVREPYVPFGGKMRLVRGQIDDGGTLTLRSKMRQARLFLDGEDNVFEIGIGDVVTMRRSEEFLTVLGLSRTPERVSRPDALR